MLSGTHKSASDFICWLDSIVDRFRHAVEDSDLWRALWNDDLTAPRDEKIVQTLAAQVWIAYCQAAEVDISREPNIGRGAVDFKFSSGWTHRAILEIKLLASRHLIRGAALQLPQYMASEEVDTAFYVCVGFTHSDLRPQRLARVQRACATATERSGVRVVPRFIDARPKLAASRL